MISIDIDLIRKFNNKNKIEIQFFFLEVASLQNNLIGKTNTIEHINDNNGKSKCIC